MPVYRASVAPVARHLRSIATRTQSAWPQQVTIGLEGSRSWAGACPLGTLCHQWQGLAPPISLDARLATTTGSSEPGLCDREPRERRTRPGSGRDPTLEKPFDLDRLRQVVEGTLAIGSAPGATLD
jgi:hypothetical protein